MSSTKPKCDVTVDELEQDKVTCERIETLLKCEKFSLRGMWSSSTGLVEYIKEDLKTVADRGVNVNAIVDRIAQLQNLAMASKEYKILPEHDSMMLIGRHWMGHGTMHCEIPGAFRVSLAIWGGAQKCPFQRPEDKSYHGYEYGSTDLFVTNLKTGKKIHIPSVSAHMIEKHGFFQNTTYPVRPDELIDVLDIQPGRDYKSIFIAPKWHDDGLFGSSFTPFEKVQLPKPEYFCVATHEGEGYVAYQMSQNHCRVDVDRAMDAIVEFDGAPFDLKCGQAGTFMNVSRMKLLNVEATLQNIKDEGQTLSSNEQ